MIFPYSGHGDDRVRIRCCHGYDRGRGRMNAHGHVGDGAGACVLDRRVYGDAHDHDCVHAHACVCVCAFRWS